MGGWREGCRGGGRKDAQWELEEREGMHCTHLPIRSCISFACPLTYLLPLLLFLPFLLPPAFANPADYAQKNAELKAQEVAIKLFASAAAADGGEQKTIIVIGSDTMYVVTGMRVGRERRLRVYHILSLSDDEP